MVEATIRMVDGNVSVTTLWASRGKDQMCTFTTDFDRARAGYSPDRLDALVCGLTELLVKPMPQWGIFEVTRQRAEELQRAR